MNKKQKVEFLTSLEAGRQKLENLRESFVLPSWFDHEGERGSAILQGRFGKDYRVLEKRGKKIVVGRVKTYQGPTGGFTWFVENGIYSLHQNSTEPAIAIAEAQYGELAELNPDMMQHIIIFRDFSKKEAH